ncbi:MAG: PSD1 domain-containing protein [Verrucomicrobiaceae bacterium]|nr:PSD1 domain-containing protein [Verrucomicrobiaceae bacterium]
MVLRSRPNFLILSLAIATLGLCASGQSFAAAGALEFNRDIRPILSDHCFACHGIDAKKRKADLRLDLADGAYAVIDGKQAIKPGHPESSTLMERILTTDPDEVMPPPESHKPLKPAQIEILKRWIAAGAVYQKHWAFEAPKKVAPPTSAANPAAPIRNPIDVFLQARLAEENLSPAPEASKETLIRRVTLDLTGLPPTLAEIDAFVADTKSDAYDRLVARLLENQRYGEHMARYWLDAARYADTHGLHLDNERSMWPYRDWVVQAFNDNLPYDQFTLWQLAGDLLPNATREQRIASGFNRCNVTTSEGGSINEEFIHRYAIDRTDTTVAVWMGLTAGCAVCHDHKYDPISQREFYSLYAFFNSAADPAMDGNILLTPPVLRLTSADQDKEIASLDQQLAAVDAQIKKDVASIGYTDPSEQNPPPVAKSTETIWFDDAFPPGANPQASGAPLQIVTKAQSKAGVASGNAALTRTAKGVAQDYFSGGVSLTPPSGGKVFVSCYLDPANPPRAVMIQFHSDGWKHRAIWGEESAIAFGKSGTAEKVHMGPLPKVGEWARLEIDAVKMGLKPTTKITGFAFTQCDGTVTWDRLGVSSIVQPATDPTWSYKVWLQKNQGRRVEEIPDPLRTLVRGKKPETWTPDEAKQVRQFWLENVYQGTQERIAPLLAERTSLTARRKSVEETVPATLVMADMPKPRESFIMKRGQYDQPGEPVTRNTPAVFPALPENSQRNRVDLAKWLTSADHPLTARVQVNRLWQQFFGIGLVKTSNDFGSQGEPPSHPALLDWMAVTFRESGWDMKEMVRLIVTSHAYRQDSRVPSTTTDPDNRLLARGPRFRLDAEVIRDQALAVSGLLSPTVGGKGVKPYQPDNIWEPLAFGGSNTRYYKQDKGENLYRRSLYTFWKRTAPPPMMTTFDAPNRESFCLRRERSNTPLQALNLMNDVQFFEASRNLAQRILIEGGNNTDARVTFAFRTATGRYPSAEEAEIIRQTIQQHLTAYAARAEDAKAAITYGESLPKAGLDPTELAAWTMIANLLLNLDEVVTK